jgi:hypothetical protein
MQCPSCKEPIDNDSRFCDLCGGKIMFCPSCNIPRKGKFCTQCNSELVPAGSASAPVQATTQAAPQISSTSPAVSFAPSASSGTIKLSSTAQGIIIEVADGDIIGRKAGKFAAVFGRFNFVSGTHCKITKIGTDWVILDLGSTNGTFCNGSKLAPNTPCSITNGMTIKIADVEMVANCDEETGTARI